MCKIYRFYGDKYHGETQAGKGDAKCWMPEGGWCGQRSRVRGGRSCRALTVTVKTLAIFGEKREGALEGSEQNDTGQLRLSQEPSGSIRLGSNVPDTAPGLPRGDTTLVLNPAIGSFSRNLRAPLGW